LLGLAVATLGGRSSPATCHLLVKCRTPWDTMNSVIVWVATLGDTPASPQSFDPARDRHVARLDNAVLR